MTQEEAIQKYGPIVDGTWADEAKWMVSVPIPPEFASNWINTANKAPVNHLYMNREMREPLLQALLNLEQAGVLNELKTMDGCFNIRSIRGMPNLLSAHSYGMAIDINAATNVLGVTPSLSPEFVKCFKAANFYWGGDFQRVDGMHFSLLGF